jgi:hypothetical protein
MSSGSGVQYRRTSTVSIITNRVAGCPRERITSGHAGAVPAVLAAPAARVRPLKAVPAARPIAAAPAVLDRPIAAVPAARVRQSAAAPDPAAADRDGRPHGAEGPGAAAVGPASSLQHRKKREIKYENIFFHSVALDF